MALVALSAFCMAAAACSSSEASPSSDAAVDQGVVADAGQLADAGADSGNTVDAFAPMDMTTTDSGSGEDAGAVDAGAADAAVADDGTGDASTTDAGALGLTCASATSLATNTWIDLSATAGAVQNDCLACELAWCSMDPVVYQTVEVPAGEVLQLESVSSFVVLSGCEAGCETAHVYGGASTPIANDSETPLTVLLAAVASDGNAIYANVATPSPNVSCASATVLPTSSTTFTGLHFLSAAPGYVTVHGCAFISPIAQNFGLYYAVDVPSGDTLSATATAEVRVPGESFAGSRAYILDTCSNGTMNDEAASCQDAGGPATYTNSTGVTVRKYILVTRGSAQRFSLQIELTSP